MGTPWSEAKWAGWTSFQIAFTEPSVWRSLWTTLKFAAVSVSAEMVLGIALALALEGNLRGMAFFRSLFILPMMVAPIAVGLTWRYMFDAQFGLINAVLVALGFAAQGLARRGVAGVRGDHHRRHLAVDAVRLHHGRRRPRQRRRQRARGGAHRRRALVDGDHPVKLPMIAHVLAITLVMRLIDAFRVLEVIYVLTFGGPGESHRGAVAAHLQDRVHRPEARRRVGDLGAAAGGRDGAHLARAADVQSAAGATRTTDEAPARRPRPLRGADRSSACCASARSR